MFGEGQGVLLGVVVLMELFPQVMLKLVLTVCLLILTIPEWEMVCI